MGAAVLQIGAAAESAPAGASGLAACRSWAPPLLFGAVLGGYVTSLAGAQRPRMKSSAAHEDDRRARRRSEVYRGEHSGR